MIQRVLILSDEDYTNLEQEMVKKQNIINIQNEQISEYRRKLLEAERPSPKLVEIKVRDTSTSEEIETLKQKIITLESGVILHKRQLEKIPKWIRNIFKP